MALYKLEIKYNKKYKGKKYIHFVTLLMIHMVDKNPK